MAAEPPAPQTLTPEALPAGPDGVLVRFALTPLPDAIAAAQVLADRLERDPPAGVTEIVPALVSVLVRFDPGRTPRAPLAEALSALAGRAAADRPALPAPLRRWTIPAAFGGEDGRQLAELAGRLELTEAETVRQICTADLRVIAIGFAPGQPYIGLLPAPWDLPRLSDLTPQVPAGAITVAVRQIVMFGAASATGWRQIGRAAFRSFRPERDPPMPLRPGDAIRFAPADAAEIAALAETPDGMGGARLERLA